MKDKYYVTWPGLIIVLITVLVCYLMVSVILEGLIQISNDTMLKQDTDACYMGCMMALDHYPKNVYFNKTLYCSLKNLDNMNDIDCFDFCQHKAVYK
jgi:hypothetical protein